MLLTGGLGLPIAGELVTETLECDGGREVTVYVPPQQPEAVVFAGDGQVISNWGAALETTDVPSTMIVGAHRRDDETVRLHEYSPGFDPERFAAHERFFVQDVRRWVRTRFGVALPAGRTAVCGVSASGELALAIGLRHPDLYGAIFCASPGGGYRPPVKMPSSIPRTYLVAGTREQFFLENATRWADALRDAGAEVIMNERPGSHGDAFWQEELPLMVAWALENEPSRRPSSADVTSRLVRFRGVVADRRICGRARGPLRRGRRSVGSEVPQTAPRVGNWHTREDPGPRRRGPPEPRLGSPAV